MTGASDSGCGGSIAGETGTGWLVSPLKSDSRHPRPGFQGSLASRAPRPGASVPTGRLAAAPGWPRTAGALRPDRPSTAGRCRRNAVCRVGVKLGAAPDAPHWGKVLVRTPSDRILVPRMRATSKFTCLSREHPACPAEATNADGHVHGSTQPRLRWPVGSGGGRRRGRKTSWPVPGLRTSGNPAWADCQADMAAYAVRTTRKSGQHVTAPVAVTRTPGRTPCERNHGLVLC